MLIVELLIYHNLHFLILFVIPVKQDFIQFLAKGIYDAQYQIYDGIWISKKSSTKILLSRTIAEKRVPRRARQNIALAILLVEPTIFLHCLTNPIKKPVAARDNTFPKEYKMANLAGLPAAMLIKDPSEII
eukprot:GHVR01026952.1.p1 GENE.GHVR01026952.1~~GHVR01026952.1.p1  ORF type:complete len:131 (+),score=3.67 GHVR01026952.1:1180-1572(+)